MAQDIKRGFLACFSNTTFDLMRKHPSKDDMEKYITGLFDIEVNRQLVFKTGKIVKVFRETLFEQAKASTGNEYKEIFVNALLKHKKETYEPLLEDLIAEMKKDEKEKHK